MALRAYLRLRPELEHEVVFVTHYGNLLEIDRLGDVVERRTKAAKVTGVRCSPHTFRYTSAVEFPMAGGDSFNLQTILGHTTMGMTRRYVNFAQTMNTIHRCVSPVEAIVPQVCPGRKRIDVAKRARHKS